MSDWLTDEQLNEEEQNLRMAYGGRPSSLVISKLIAQAREANRLRAELTKYLEASVAGGTRWQIFKDILEPKP